MDYSLNKGCTFGSMVANMYPISWNCRNDGLKIDSHTAVRFAESVWASWIGVFAV